MDWADLVQPAIDLARDGMPVSWYLHDSFRRQADQWQLYPSSAKIFLKPDGSFYQPGDTWKQPDLAATLTRIRDNGKDGFYKGRTADLVHEFMAENGGIITREDLAKYEAQEREPIRGNYRGYEIVSMPPPSSGGVALVQMLNILEGFDLKEIGHNSALYLHLLTESMRRAYADRANFLGDADFNEDMPLAMLTSKEHAARQRETIVLHAKSESDPARFAQLYESEETTHFSVADKDGNMVSLTYTLEHGYGSKIVVEGAGFLLNNEMGDFNAQPGVTDINGRIGTEPNQIRPQQRMLSSMTPTVVAKDGIPLFATGSPGGKTIINTTMQTILNIIDHGMSIAEGSKVWVALRPEKVKVSKQPPSDTDTNNIKGMVNDIGYLGGTSTYRVLVGDEHIVEVTSPNLNRPRDGNPPIDWDEEVHLSWEPSSAVVLTK